MKGVILALLVCVAVVLADNNYLIAQRNNLSSRWRIEGRANPQDTINFRILLKQQNLDKLEHIFWDVSDPLSANYGKYLTMQETKALIAPPPSSVRKVMGWLAKSGVAPSSMRVFSDYIQITTSVDLASQLFGTTFSVFRSSKTKTARIRIDSSAFIPADLTNEIDFVLGISELIDEAIHKPVSFPSNVALDNLTQLITPSILQSYYNIPTARATNESNLQGIAAFFDFFSLDAMQAFDAAYSIDAVNVTVIGSNCLGSDCDQYESDLDIQYVTSLGLGVPTDFIVSAEGEWVLDWAQDLSNMPNAPLVNSISYGWSELDQCVITTDCSSFGYNSQQYINKVNTELMGFGSRGISIMVSSGDDGAPSYYNGARGNCPMDPKVFCPLGGCAHTSSSCVEFSIFYEANSTDICFFPMGVGSHGCDLVLTDDDFSDIMEGFFLKNLHCKMKLDGDVMGNTWIYSECACSDIKSHTSHGLTMEGYTYSQSNGPLFIADWPTSSPYVTSVGATLFTWAGSHVKDEVVCSIESGAIITGGGGFSTFQTQPSYQTQAVTNWLQSGSNIPPSYSFNPKNRAYPDVSFNGHNFLIYVSNNTADLSKCPCVPIPVDGTSCSSPSFTASISMLNDALLNAGRPQLGFLNPLLYQMVANAPSTFNDITSGNNNCNRAFCCQYGYSASKGWDPASGLGSPDFAQIAQYLNITN